MFNTSLLKSKIERSGLKKNHIAKMLGMSAYGLYKKIEGKNEFKVSEIKSITDILHLSAEERDEIFFVE